MALNAKFWTLLALFQVVFGFAVFAVTRDYYANDTAAVQTQTSSTVRPALVWPDSAPAADTAAQSTLTLVDPGFSDPVELSRQANVYFANEQYDRAAEMYERLLVFDPGNVDTYNNLGLTLHYLNRSTEALGKLNDGIAVNPEHQRIWLTLGFINSQLGNTEQARAALTRAQVGTDTTIRESAAQMLEALP